MKLNECNMGLIVEKIKENGDTLEKVEIGHIVGLTSNGTHVIPEILFEGRKYPCGIHPANIQKLKKYIC